MIVHKLTKDCKPAERQRVWLWRDDRKRWVIETMLRGIDIHIGNPALAYTHWCELQEPPVPAFDCENCIGMPEAGCYCAAMGAVAPGGPLRD